MCLFLLLLPTDVQQYVLQTWIHGDTEHRNRPLLLAASNLDIACCNQQVRPLCLHLLASLSFPDHQPHLDMPSSMETATDMCLLDWLLTRKVAIRSLSVGSKLLTDLYLTEAFDRINTFQSVQTVHFQSLFGVASRLNSFFRWFPHVTTVVCNNSDDSALLMHYLAQSRVPLSMKAILIEHGTQGMPVFDENWTTVGTPNELVGRYGDTGHSIDMPQIARVCGSTMTVVETNTLSERNWTDLRLLGQLQELSVVYFPTHHLSALHDAVRHATWRSLRIAQVIQVLSHPVQQSCAELFADLLEAVHWKYLEINQFLFARETQHLQLNVECTEDDVLERIIAVVGVVKALWLVSVPRGGQISKVRRLADLYGPTLHSLRLDECERSMTIVLLRKCTSLHTLHSVDFFGHQIMMEIPAIVQCFSAQCGEETVVELLTRCPLLCEVQVLNPFALVPWTILQAILDHGKHMRRFTLAGFQDPAMNVEKFRQQAKEKSLLPVPRIGQVRDVPAWVADNIKVIDEERWVARWTTRSQFFLSVLFCVTLSVHSRFKFQRPFSEGTDRCQGVNEHIRGFDGHRQSARRAQSMVESDIIYNTPSTLSLNSFSP